MATFLRISDPSRGSLKYDSKLTLSRFGDGLFAVPSETSLGVGRRKLAVDVAEATELGPVKTSDPKGPYWRKKPTQVITFFQFQAEIRTLPGS